MDPSGLPQKHISQLQDLTGMKWDKKSNQKGFANREVANDICKEMCKALNIDNKVLKPKKDGDYWKVSIRDIKKMSHALDNTLLLDMTNAISKVSCETKSKKVEQAEKLLNNLFKSKDPENAELRKEVLNKHFQASNKFLVHNIPSNPTTFVLRPLEDKVLVEIDGHMLIFKLNEENIESIIKDLVNPTEFLQNIKQQKAEKKAKKAEREAEWEGMQKAEQEAKQKTEQEAKEKAFQEAYKRQQAGWEAIKPEREATLKAEQEAKQKAAQEAKMNEGKSAKEPSKTDQTQAAAKLETSKVASTPYLNQQLVHPMSLQQAEKLLDKVSNGFFLFIQTDNGEFHMVYKGKVNDKDRVMSKQIEPSAISGNMIEGSKLSSLITEFTKSVGGKSCIIDRDTLTNIAPYSNKTDAHKYLADKPDGSFILRFSGSTPAIIMECKSGNQFLSKELARDKNYNDTDPKTYKFVVDQKTYTLPELQSHPDFINPKDDNLKEAIKLLNKVTRYKDYHGEATELLKKAIPDLLDVSTLDLKKNENGFSISYEGGDNIAGRKMYTRQITDDEIKSIVAILKQSKLVESANERILYEQVVHPMSLPQAEQLLDKVSNGFFLVIKTGDSDFHVVYKVKVNDKDQVMSKKIDASGEMIEGSKLSSQLTEFTSNKFNLIDRDTLANIAPIYNKTEAQKLLAGRPDGSFIMRFSGSTPAIILEIKYGNDISSKQFVRNKNTNITNPETYKYDMTNPKPNAKADVKTLTLPVLLKNPDIWGAGHFIPPTDIDRDTLIYNAPIYSVDEARTFLAGKPEGSFILYSSETSPGSIMLEKIEQGKMQSVKYDQVEGNKYKNNDETFTLSQIVQNAGAKGMRFIPPEKIDRNAVIAQQKKANLKEAVDLLNNFCARSWSGNDFEKRDLLKEIIPDLNPATFIDLENTPPHGYKLKWKSTYVFNAEWKWSTRQRTITDESIKQILDILRK